MCLSILLQWQWLDLVDTVLVANAGTIIICHLCPTVFKGFVLLLGAEVEDWFQGFL